MNFFSEDFGAFVFGQKVLQQTPQLGLSFCVGKTPPENAFRPSDFWEKGLQEIVAGKTKFGRIAIVHDRKTICHDLQKITPKTYTPLETKRAEKSPKISFFETQVLAEMANEGLSDSVEFRRLFRKTARKIKSHNVDSVFFLDTILAEQKTRNIIQHILGKQIHVFFPVDFFQITDEKKQIETVHFYIPSQELSFVKLRAQKILRTKISDKSLLV